MIELYGTEVSAPMLPLALGARGPGVVRVQEWLGLSGRGVVIDGDYGSATARAVSEYRASNGFPVGETVDMDVWRCLVLPLAGALFNIAASGTFAATVVEVADQYLSRQAREIGGDNRGPWVRHFCRGQSVAWCQGFASTVWAGATLLAGGGSPPLNLTLDGIWCLFVPRMVQEARASGRFADGRSGTPPKPGAMFFLRGGPYGYLHVGIVEQAHSDGTMTTIEGNTNHDGSANGYEVCRRVRRTETCDFGAA